MLRPLAAITLLLLSPALADAAPVVSNIEAPANAALYQKYEITFNVTTVAENLYWPYDENPNPGVAARTGISVDGLFSKDNWQTTIVQPGFLYQNYLENGRNLGNGRSWLYPVGTPVWKVRFAPTEVGEWKFRIRVTDASGTVTSQEHLFVCSESGSHGFVRVSPTDPRYFELSDGTYVPMIGLDCDVSNISNMEAVFDKLEGMGINLLRTWWMSSKPNTALFGAGGMGGDGSWANLKYTTEYTLPGQLVVAKLDKENNLHDGLYTTVPVKPNTTYVAKALVKTVGLIGTGDYGLYLDVWPCEPSRSSYLKGDNDWRELTHTFTTSKDTYEIGWFGVKLINITDGAAYVGWVSLKEKMADGKMGPEIVGRSDFQAHKSWPQSIAYTIDKQLEYASQRGIYLKIVTEEKGDSFFARIQPDGTWGDFANDNVYANNKHASRTLQSYYWRYLIARYGYSTAIHSFEMFNEADPYNGNHQDAVAAMAAYFRDNGPSKHLVSTSNWHSIPPAFWRNADLPYADLHMYLGWGVAMGGNRLWPGWDGSWTVVNNAADESDCGKGFAFDFNVAHSGRSSLKMTRFAHPGYPNDNNGAGDPYHSNLSFQCGVTPGHRIRISLWAKAENFKTYDNYTSHADPLMVTYHRIGSDYAGEPASLYIPTGTYDWQKVACEFIVPNEGVYMLGVCPRRRPNWDTADGFVWIDDVLVEDLTAGITLNYNGGFEYTSSQSYDVVGGHCAYSHLVNSLNLGKPVVRGEVGFCHPKRFTDNYKGFDYTGEDQLLVDDVDGVWWHKWVWAQLYPGGLYEIYWWYQLPLAREFKHASIFRAFMSGIPLSNGHYKDVAATVSNPVIRVLGQKDLVNNRAHLWIDNSKHTWKNVVDGVAIPAVSGTVTVDGLKDGPYKVEWWNTTTGEISRTEDVQCTGGKINLNVQNLQSDVACKINPATGSLDLRISVPSINVVPGDTVTVTVEYVNSGQSEARNAVVTAAVPDQMEYVEGSAEATGGTWDASAKVVSWTLSSVAAGQSGTRTFKARVK